jgi:hypothetical protein
MRAIHWKVPRHRSLRVSRFDLGELLVVGVLGLVAAFILMMIVAGVTGGWSASP